MSILAVGSVALDTVETPAGRVDDALGGSAVYFSCAASLFTEVRLVGVAGSDFPREHIELLRARRIDSSALEIRPGATFRWHGRYSADMNARETLRLELNVFGQFDPVIPPHFRDTQYVFLGNCRPALQHRILKQVHKPRFAMADTMNHWITNNRKELEQLISGLDGLVLNDEEARLLGEEGNLLHAGKRIAAMGPKVVIVKKGEHGSLLFADGECTPLPAYPIERLVDPTGAGDSFAGGVMGYIAERGDISPATLRRAVAYGTVLASFTVEDFGLGSLGSVTRKEVESRLADYRAKLQV